MDKEAYPIYDVVGIGFGPSNLSLAIALDELRSDETGEPPEVAFFEKNSSFSWHRNMLLPAAKMQVSFVKDLVTFRNPTSPFSFVSYLHERGRLPQFINNHDFFPTRREFHDYLEWVAARFSDRVAYDARVTEVDLPHEADPERPADHVRVRTGTDPVNGRPTYVSARNVVISTGLVPKMPIGVERDERVCHSSEFLERFRGWDKRALKRVVVVGTGQSAAEIVRFLYESVPDAEVTAVLPAYGYPIADNTPFANQVFDPAAVDDYYYGMDDSKDVLWQYHKNTNYSVVDDEVIRDLYQRVYSDEVVGQERIKFMRLSRVTGVKRVADDTRVTVHSTATDQVTDIDVDAVVCATGYEPMDPAGALGGLEKYCVRDERGRYRVERDYRLTTTPHLRCGIYIQGGTEHTHGLSSSLLSNIAVRSGEIARSIADGLTAGTVRAS
ncbi:lysine N(6)-hydroxylase/L-ornithine N(5)-oxygenase family protein [Streptomyces sp. NPDC058268]|uniref:lysine N(6)-hydroxylase/L-ornithine N(5)-oxygenase family protein n=1 Tax=Streptomyces sp. NPDC058268 TaxID=3346413 RepID=UPI0036E31B69